MGRSNRVPVLAAGVAVGVGSLVVGGTAWSLGASSGAAGRPVSTTDVFPTSTRSKTITFDAEAQLRALVDLPDPLPVLSEGSRCVDLVAHDGTWPVFNGSTLTVPGYSAQLCPQPALGSWTVGWYGTAPGMVGGKKLSAMAAFEITVDGSVPVRMSASMRSDLHRYGYGPDWEVDDGQSDQYILTDSYYGDGVATTLAATGSPTVPTTQPASSTGNGTGAGTATAAQPVPGSPGYTG